MRTLIIIPAFNEEKSIKKVIDSIKSSGIGADIVVINDGSSDNTAIEAKQDRVRVINLPVNLGIGGAVQTGFLYAYEHHYDIAIQVDGDGQHDGKDVARLVSELTESRADLIIGSRFVEKSNYSAGATRSVGIKFFSKVVSKIIRYPVFDTTSGFRAVNKRGIELFRQYYPIDYPEVESIVYAYKMGLNIKEVPVNMNPRLYGKSSISLYQGLYYLVKVTIMLLLLPKRPLLE